jgi:hypothetical protein
VKTLAFLMTDRLLRSVLRKPVIRRISIAIIAVGSCAHDWHILTKKSVFVKGGTILIHYAKWGGLFGRNLSMVKKDFCLSGPRSQTYPVLWPNDRSPYRP